MVPLRRSMKLTNLKTYITEKKEKKYKLPISETREEIIKITEANGRLPQDGPLWDEHYFELKAIKTQEI